MSRRKQELLQRSARLLRFVFPDRCVFCGSADASGYFCVGCRLDLPYIGDGCSRCGEPLSLAAKNATDCAHCQRHPPPFDKARSALLYTFPVDTALKSFKFGRQLYYAPAFAELLFATFLRDFQHCDALVPVPLHLRRHSMRGFNQAVELSGALSRKAGLPRLRNARRTRYTKPQTGLDAASRRRNMKNAFAVAGNLGCRHPLIVDDVMTTGETCRHLALTLLDAGAASVGVLTVARAAQPALSVCDPGTLMPG